MKSLVIATILITLMTAGCLGDSDMPITEIDVSVDVYGDYTGIDYAQFWEFSNLQWSLGEGYQSNPSDSSEREAWNELEQPMYMREADYGVFIDFEGRLDMTFIIGSDSNFATGENNGSLKLELDMTYDSGLFFQYGSLLAKIDSDGDGIYDDTFFNGDISIYHLYTGMNIMIRSSGIEIQLRGDSGAVTTLGTLDNDILLFTDFHMIMNPTEDIYHWEGLYVEEGGIPI